MGTSSGGSGRVPTTTATTTATTTDAGERGRRRERVPALGGRRAYLVWGIGVLAYAVAVFHRSSLGVAGTEAAQRFGVSAATLALFSMVQLFVYAAMQVPVGVLLDRFGSKRLVLTGAALMASGQLLFALAGDLPMGLLARVLLGVGDAMTFISVLRLVVLWFPPERNPVLVQLTGVLGQLGALASALPLVAVLRGAGWTSTFLAASLVGLATAVLVALFLRDRPSAEPAGGRAGTSTTDVRRSLGLAWGEPGTRLGFWTHLVTQFSGLVFLLLWGFPFLVAGQGVSPATAALLLSLLTLASVVSGPVLGALTARHPFHRSRLVFGIVGLTAAAWTLVLAWPGRAPLALLVALVVVLGVNGPGSAIGFDYARSFNPTSRVGSASGIVNVGGFTASLVTVALIGVVLDALTPGQSTAYSLDAFRGAFAVQYVVWALGVTQVLRYRGRVRREMAERDPEAYAALRDGRVLAVR